MKAIRLALAVILAMVQPAVHVICITLMLLGFAVSVLFEVSGAAETFSFWMMVGISSSFGVFAFLYAVLVAWLSHDPAD